MNKLNVKKGDTVVVISGKDKGKQGKILVAYPEKERVVVQNANMIVKHVKPRRQGEPGGRIEKEGTRIGHKIEEVEIGGKKKMKSVRYCKNDKCGARID